MLNDFVVFFLLGSCGTVVVYSNLFTEGLIDILERSLLSLGEQKVDSEPIEERRNDEDEKEPPTDIVEGDGTRDENDDLCHVPSEHANRHTLATNVRWEDF